MSRDAQRAVSLTWLPLLIAFALIAAALVTRAMLGAASTPLINDADDAMRLTVVRDLLAGQGWFDPMQHRLNTPFGAQMHWSRLVDLPIATLILLLRPLGGATAETVATYIWPLGLLLALLWLNARLALAMVGREGLLPALVLPAFSLITMAEFAPGRIDHHSVQILLMLATLLCSVHALSRPRFAIGAGLAAATAIAIGIESLPFVAAAILAFGLLWVFAPSHVDAVRRFGASFALGMLVHLVLALPPERWFVPSCDAISIVYAGFAIATGLGLLALSALPLAERPLRVRLAAGAAVGGIVLTGMVLMFPGCVRGPYANLDPWLLTNWIGRIAEAQPFWVSFGADPIYPLAVGVPPLLAVAVVTWRVLKGPRQGREAWLIYAVFLVLTVVAMLLQIRVARMATTLAVPAGAWLIVAVRARYLQHRQLAPLLGLVGSWLGFAGLAIAIAASLVVMAFPEYEKRLGDPLAGARAACLMPSAFADLAALPPERIMAPVDLGSHMLLFTAHEVVAAPYHRDSEGVRDSFAFFSGPIEAGRAILERRGISLVVICPQLPELRGMGEVAADSFVRLYPKGQLPAWLVDRSFPGAALKVFAVVANP